MLRLPGLEASVFLSSFGGAVVQSIFAHKIYVFSQGQLLIPIFCWFLSVMRVVGGIAATIFALHATTIPDFIHQRQWLLTSLMAVAAATDVIIALSLTYYFRKRRSDAMTV
jgi:hypothetical protein